MTVVESKQPSCFGKATRVRHENSPVGLSLSEDRAAEANNTTSRALKTLFVHNRKVACTNHPHRYGKPEFFCRTANTQNFIESLWWL